MKHIIVGTYKTNSESEGWYINRTKYCVLWEKLSEICGKKFTTEDSYYNLDLKLGRVKSANIYFYDLKKFDINAKMKNEKGKIKPMTKDKDLFFKYPNDLINGVMYLDSLLKSFNEDIRIGLMGNNLVGLFILYYLDKQNLLNSKSDLFKLTKNQGKNINYGLINKLNDVLPKNVSVYKIYNVTQRPNQKSFDLHFDKTWDEFLKDCK